VDVGVGVGVQPQPAAVLRVLWRWCAHIELGSSGCSDPQTVGLPCIVQGSEAGQTCKVVDVIVGGGQHTCSLVLVLVVVRRLQTVLHQRGLPRETLLNGHRLQVAHCMLQVAYCRLHVAHIT